jgi:hypothetical protein
MIELSVTDVKQGLQTFFVTPRDDEHPAAIWRRLIKIAVRRFSRESGVPEAEVLIVRVDPWRSRDGSLRFDIPVGPILIRLGKGLAAVSCEGGEQPAVNLPVASSRVQQAKSALKKSRKRSAVTGRARSGSQMSRMAVKSVALTTDDSRGAIRSKIDNG